MRNPNTDALMRVARGIEEMEPIDRHATICWLAEKYLNLSIWHLHWRELPEEPTADASTVTES